MTVRLKWNGVLSSPIEVQQGAQQGGLSSPSLFNLLYQQLIKHLNSNSLSLSCGITLKQNNCNVFCYAYDILLLSTNPPLNEMDHMAAKQRPKMETINDAATWNLLLETEAKRLKCGK